MIRVSKDMIIKFHSKMIILSGGTDGIRDEGLLDSAINAPFQTFGGEELYPDPILKAAITCRSIVNNHPFTDGNKRTGIHTMMMLLKLNGYALKCTNEELVDMGLDVASGKMNVEEIYRWLIEHII